MSSKEYMAAYMLKRYHERRAIVIDRLGNICATCGGSEPFEIDHIDRTQKSFDIARLWGCSWSKFNSELQKCQLLCKSCHQLKTILERGNKPAKGTHGTVSAAKYCGPPRCESCKAAVRATPSYKTKRPNSNQKPRVVPLHGTRARYIRKCRCLPCKKANAEYSAKLRA